MIRRYYGALIVAAVHGETKEDLLDDSFYARHRFQPDNTPLHPHNGYCPRSYKKNNGYDDGIRGTGYILNASSAALWAFWSDNDLFESSFSAVNLGDDTVQQ